IVIVTPVLERRWMSSQLLPPIVSNPFRGHEAVPAEAEGAMGARAFDWIVLAGHRRGRRDRAVEDEDAASCRRNRSGEIAKNSVSRHAWTREGRAPLVSPERYVVDSRSEEILLLAVINAGNYVRRGCIKTIANGALEARK